MRSSCMTCLSSYIPPPIRNLLLIWTHWKRSQGWVMMIGNMLLSIPVKYVPLPPHLLLSEGCDVYTDWYRSCRILWTTSLLDLVNSFLESLQIILKRWRVRRRMRRKLSIFGMRFVSLPWEICFGEMLMRCCVISSPMISTRWSRKLVYSLANRL